MTPLELRARLERELANWRHALATLPYPPPLAAALRTMIASHERQDAALAVGQSALQLSLFDARDEGHP